MKPDTFPATRWQTVLAIDFDRWAAETYRANFPGVEVRCASVADEIDRLPYADVLLGGPPCQPFSTAGEGKGSDDARDCIPDFLAAVRRVRPRMFLMENVPGLMNARHARYLGGVVREMEQAGYAVDARELDAVNYGVPQFRNRVWYWGISTEAHAQGVRHKWPKQTHTWPAQECMFGGALPTAITCGLGLGLVHRRTANPKSPQFYPTDEPAGTQLAAKAGEQFYEPRVIGAGTNPHYAGEDRSERDITAEPSTTIAAQHTHNALPAVREYRWSDAMLEKHPPASPASPAPTVQAKWFKGGAEGLVIAPDVLAKIESRDVASGHVTPRELHDSEPARTLGAKNISNCHTGDAIRLRDGPMVRRLDPLECLRLQSGPDDFRWPDGITKTAMYRIVGNGWASGLAAHLSRALADADPKSRTVIDLFCGGGLGACGWHQRYWSYTPDAAGRESA